MTNAMGKDFQFIMSEMVRRGFHPPRMPMMVKADPRGSEYGSFGVWVADADNIVVEWTPVDEYEQGGKYRIHFRGEDAIKDFVNWTQQCA